MINNLLKPSVPYYLSQTTEEITNKINIIGFGFDGTACFRKGTKNGPNAIREASEGIESYSPYLDRDLENIEFYDLGDVPLGKGNDQTENWKVGTDSFLNIFRPDHIKNGTKILTLAQ